MGSRRPRTTGGARAVPVVAELGIDLIAYRNVDRRFPFLWETADQPAARWHDEGEGPVHYLADTPDGAWAEFLRHEEITDPAELKGVDRGLWCVEIGPAPEVRPRLRRDVLQGDLGSYAACRRYAARVRRGGATGLTSLSAALAGGAAGGFVVDGGEKPAKSKDGRVFVLFGRRPDLVGWPAGTGRPRVGLLERIRHFGAAG